MSIVTKILLFFRLPLTVKNWWTYLLLRGGYVKTSTATYHLRGGLSLTVRTGTSDTPVFNDIWMGGVYDAPSLDWKKVRTVIDVGAHIGTFALYALRRNPNVVVYACEPEPSNAEILCLNVTQNHLENDVFIEEKGVADAPGTLTLNVMPQRGESNSLYRQTENSIRVDIPVTTLHELFTKYAIEHCDLLKMNCEGAEYEIFYTLTPEYFARIDAMIINYHFYSPNPKHHPLVLKAHLEKQGFTVTKTAKNIYFAQRK